MPNYTTNPGGVSKNVGPWLAFPATWFQERQTILLFLLNAPVIRWWFRWVMCIDTIVDVWLPRGTKITELGTSYYKVRCPDGQFRLNARTHPKYAKRVYFAFRYLWWCLHYFDTIFADRFAPALSYGFATLEVFPDPDPETTTVDGMMRDTTVDQTWAEKIAAAGNGAFPSIASTGIQDITADSGTNKWAQLRRSIYLFDTSGLGSGSSISDAVLSIMGVASKADDLGVTPNIDIYTSTPASNTNLVGGDFAQLGSVSQTGAPITYAGWSDSVYNAFTFDATGRGNVSKTGVSKFGARNANYDVAGVQPTWGANLSSQLLGAFADTAGTTSDPKLVVTYSAAATLGGPLVGGRLANSGLLVGGRLAR